MDYDLDNIYKYHPPRSNNISAQYERLRSMGKRTASEILEHCPDCREKDTALERIEEGIMWANAAIARHSDGFG